jgi:hypothetical protein
MAVKYRFDKAHDYRIRDKKSGTLLGAVSYSPGTEMLIPEDHAADADAKGAGSRLTGDQDARLSSGRKASDSDQSGEARSSGK